MRDRRKTLRAHWPPRIINHLQVTVPDWVYADFYLCAAAEGWSMAEEIRSRLRPAAGRETAREANQ